ncbi:MAG: coenzyme A pyrophosphatase [Flavobacteriaceae bacterium]|nr:MAG: coenzyme A pyrophosphatase [Flavobacteriaceae bacterium]
MNFNIFTTLLKSVESLPLGGLEILLEMAPEIRKKVAEDSIAGKNPRKAAVLALFYPNEQQETCFSLMERAAYNGTHSAQISFPGGKEEPTDKNLAHTALRETQEEIGIPSKNIILIKEMTTTYIPPSNFLVSPFIGICKTTPVFTANNEVKELLEIKLADLLNETNKTTAILSTSYQKNMETPCFLLNGHIVWGATAMMLNEIKHMLNKV